MMEKNKREEGSYLVAKKRVGIVSSFARAQNNKYQVSKSYLSVKIKQSLGWRYQHILKKNIVSCDRILSSVTSQNKRFLQNFL